MPSNSESDPLRLHFNILANILAGLLWLSLAAGAPAAAQELGRDALAPLEQALAGGDVETLLGQTAERIDITVFGASAVYSRSQAQYVLKDFFREYPPRRFRFQEPSQREENWFAAGQYWYEQSETPLWVYVRLRRQGAQWELREIRVDRKPGS